MRLVRFSGAANVFWSIGMHMLFVADLVDDSPLLKVYALLHDAAEVCCADVPRPMKTPEQREVEHAVQRRIHTLLGLPEQPSQEMERAIKKADLLAAMTEGAHGCAGRGYVHTQTGFKYDERAAQIFHGYLRAYDIHAALIADGYWPREYEKRVRLLLQKVHHDQPYGLQGCW